nr:zinc finger protein RFP-like isoform X1 [Anolis sagrei ordinatus]
MACGAPLRGLCEETTCPVCLEYYANPVTTHCGHSFCRGCVAPLCGGPRGTFNCPQCRASVSPKSLRPNRHLANIVEIAKSLQTGGGGGGGRGGEKWPACQRHQEPFKLFCRDDEAPICVVCDRSTEHRGHCVVPIDEVAQEYQDKIKAHVKFLKDERKNLEDQTLARQQRVQGYLNQLETEREAVASFFEEMQTFLEEKKHICLGQLGGLEKEIKKGEEENLTEVAAEISQLNERIAEMEKKCQLPASEYLQDIRNTLSRYKKNLPAHGLDLSPQFEESVRSYFEQISDLREAMKDSQESLEQALKTASWEHSLFMDSLKQGMNQVSVTLDPITAHPRLFVSENLKALRWDRIPQDLPYRPERFKKQPCVLGQEKFTSGKHCWELEILEGEAVGKDLGGEAAWAVGIARDSVKRKEYFNLHPDEGIWAVGKACEDISVPCQVSAFTAEPMTLVLKNEPKKIRVSLDCETGQVDFHDADTDDLIFFFSSASFFGHQIRPFFYTRGWEFNLKC